MATAAAAGNKSVVWRGNVGLARACRTLATGGDVLTPLPRHPACTSLQGLEVEPHPEHGEGGRHGPTPTVPPSAGWEDAGIGGVGAKTACCPPLNAGLLAARQRVQLPSRVAREPAPRRTNYTRRLCVPVRHRPPPWSRCPVIPWATRLCHAAAPRVGQPGSLLHVTLTKTWHMPCALSRAAPPHGPRGGQPGAEEGAPGADGGGPPGGRGAHPRHRRGGAWQGRGAWGVRRQHAIAEPSMCSETRSLHAPCRQLSRECVNDSILALSPITRTFVHQ